MINDLDFYVDIDDITDIDVSLLKKDIKDAKIKGKLTLIAENIHGVCTLFFESADYTIFCTWSAPTGISRQYKAQSLDSATSKASCMGMYTTPTGLIKAETVYSGQKDIDQHKLGIDWKVGK